MSQRFISESLPTQYFCLEVLLSKHIYQIPSFGRKLPAEGYS